ncbi:hypothetical protein D3C76_395750 [compost metagenome]
MKPALPTALLDRCASLGGCEQDYSLSPPADSELMTMTMTVKVPKELKAEFSVRPGNSIEDALVHAALYLRCACDICPQVLEHTNEVGRSFAWSTLHSAEMAKGLIEAVLDGIESRRSTAR